MTKRIPLRFAQTSRDDFEALRTGQKSVETRAASSRYRDIAAGDVLVISCGGDKLEKTVKAAAQFDSIEKLLAHYDFKRIMPYAQTEAEVYANYYSYSGYKEKIAQYGLVAFEL